MDRFSLPTMDRTHAGLAALLLALAVALVATPQRARAEAPTFLPKQVRSVLAPAATSARCDERQSAGSGVGTTTYTAPAGGLATVTLQGPAGGDWDLGLFDSKNRRLAGSLSAGPREIAQTWLRSGDRLTIQSCRRSGDARQATATIALAGVKTPTAGGAPQLVSVAYDSRADLERLSHLGLDVTHNIHDGRADVIVANAAQRTLLADSGFADVTTRIADLTEHFRRSQAADAGYAKRASQGSATPMLPSGRTSYRVLSDYQNDMKRLVAEHPDIVKSMRLPRDSYQGRPLEGVEIAHDVKGPAEDGRPVYLVVALHHAREWPSAEAAMEFAIMLAKGDGKNQRITELLEKARVVVVPLINPDGFVASRGFPADPADVLAGGGDHPGQGVDPNLVDPCGGTPAPPGTCRKVCEPALMCPPTGRCASATSTRTSRKGIAPPGGTGNAARKNCAGAIPNPLTPCELQHGVDPNRNYGQFWGGPGSSADVTSQSYRGPSPWSEPETTAVRVLAEPPDHDDRHDPQRRRARVAPAGHVDGRQGTRREAPQGDRRRDGRGDRLHLAVRLRAVRHRGHDRGLELRRPGRLRLHDRDWSEGRRVPHALRDGRRRRVDRQHRRGEGRRRRRTGRGAAGHRRGGGQRERPRRHRGQDGARPHPAPAQGLQDPQLGGSVLRQEIPLLLLNVPSTDGPRCLDTAEPFAVDDHLETTLTVPADGKFVWHVNPSTRPFLLKPAEEPGDVTETREVFAGSGELNPASSEVDAETARAVHTFAVGAADRIQRLTLDLAWGIGPQDYDLELCRVVSETQCDPIGTGSGSTPGSSGNLAGEPERIELAAPPVGTYKATVVRYATAVDDYELTLTRFASEGLVSDDRSRPSRAVDPDVLAA